ncbi:MAG TPA: hypothetical protein VF950_18590 [Planctomycetota bacterium]
MRHLWLLVTGLAWAGMMGLLFHREIRPYFEYQQPPSYESVLREKRHPEVQRRVVYFTEGRNKIGECETLIEPQAEGGASLRTRFLMGMSTFTPIKLPDDKVYLMSEFKVDGAWRLAEFKMDCRFQGIPLTLKGQRQGEKLFVTYNLVLARGERLVELPPDAMLSDSFLPYLGGRGLEEGKKWRIRLVDMSGLLTMGKGQELSFTEMFATVEGREVIRAGVRDVPCWKVSVREQASDDQEKWAYQLWVDEKGTVVQQLMKINRLPCTVVLEEQRILTPEAARTHRWRVEAPR